MTAETHRAVGIWKGSFQPSFVVHFSALEQGAEFVWAAELGRKHDQGAVMLFHHHPRGPDAVFRVRLRDTAHADAVAAEMAAFGLEGASYDPVVGELRVPSYDRREEDAVRVLAEATGGLSLPPDRGRLTFLDRQRYDEAIAGAFATSRPVPYNVTMEIGSTHIAELARAGRPERKRGRFVIGRPEADTPEARKAFADAFVEALYPDEERDE